MLELSAFSKINDLEVIELRAFSKHNDPEMTNARTASILLALPVVFERVRAFLDD